MQSSRILGVLARVRGLGCGVEGAGGKGLGCVQEEEEEEGVTPVGQYQVEYRDTYIDSSQTPTPSAGRGVV